MGGAPFLGSSRILRPTMRHLTPMGFAAALLLAASAFGQSYDEAVLGDLSNDRLNPTPLTLTAPNTTVTATQAGGAAVDRDYFTVTVPAGQRLRRLFVDAYTSNPSFNLAFLGFQAGSTMTVNPNLPSAATLLGGLVYGGPNVGQDILPACGTLAGALGFVPPLPAQPYTFWLNQTGAASTVTLRFVIEPNALGTPFCGPAAPNSTGASGLLAGLGTNVVAANNFRFRATQLPPNAFGFGLVSATTGFVANPGGSSGNLCLGGALGRFIDQIQSSGAGGAITVNVNAAALPQPTGAVAIAVGQTWSFQLWHRDTGLLGATSNFTEGLTVTFE